MRSLWNWIVLEEGKWGREDSRLEMFLIWLVIKIYSSEGCRIVEKLYKNMKSRSYFRI